MYEHRKIRVAALAGFHYTKASAGQLKNVFVRASETADVLALCVGERQPIEVSCDRSVTSRRQIAEAARCVRRFYYNLLIKISRIVRGRAERRHMVFRCCQDCFLGHLHEHLGFVVPDAVNIFR
jgi:hypothetical protein